MSDCALLVAGIVPVLIAVDDVQWLDASSREAVAFFARRAERLGVTVLIARASRGEPVGRPRRRPRAAYLTRLSVPEVPSSGRGEEKTGRARAPSGIVAGS